MKINTNLDYKNYYTSILKLEKNPQEMKATQFLNFLSDLVIKYRNTTETINLCKGCEK